jgi:hypothetical protein
MWGSGVGSGKNERNAGERTAALMMFGVQGGKSTPLHVKEVICCDSAPRLGTFLTWKPEMLGCGRVAKGRARREVRTVQHKTMVRMPSDLASQ